jgi:hypothetical protein
MVYINDTFNLASIFIVMTMQKNSKNFYHLMYVACFHEFNQNSENSTEEEFEFKYHISNMENLIPNFWFTNLSEHEIGPLCHQVIDDYLASKRAELEKADQPLYAQKEFLDLTLSAWVIKSNISFYLNFKGFPEGLNNNIRELEILFLRS